MLISFMSSVRVGVLVVLSSVLVLPAASVRAHEVLPAIADMTRDGDALRFEMRVNVEGFLAGIDQSSVTDTDAAPQAAEYDRFRALEPAALEAAFAEAWPTIAEKIAVSSAGARLPLSLEGIDVPAVGNVEDVRTSTLFFTASLPENAKTVSVGWDATLGTLVLRQMGVDAPYDGYLPAGSISPEFNLDGGN